MNSENTQVLMQQPLKRLIYRLHYTDGHKVLRTFDDDKKLRWFVFNEGDHLLKAEFLEEVICEVEK